MAKENRTEAPTPRRLEEARRRGQVAKSVEVSNAAILLATFGVLSVVGGRLVTELGVFMRDFLSQALVQGDLSPESVRKGAFDILIATFRMIWPVMAASVLTGITINLAQVGFLFSFEPIMPRFSRINPIAGLGRLFSGRTLVELLKSCAKVAVIGLYGYVTLRDIYPHLLATSYMEPSYVGFQIGAFMVRLGLRMAVLLGVIAVIDYFYQRKEFMDNLKMTREELREELRQTEGDPMLRARIRARQRQIAVYRMMHEVPKADVVVTNPVHLAVALKYDVKTMGAPKVVAKGARLVAERIRNTAAEHNVPIVENKPLAQALYKAVEIGEEIPSHLYKAVAELLAYVYHLNRTKGVGRTREWGRT
ncbi:MAG TPA: flagellar biosynthesis protein FlhB [Bacillota bacterium]|nr:flagellar biosynthesis protein FlhB [Bacillota bacterium]